MTEQLQYNNTIFNLNNDIDFSQTRCFIDADGTLFNSLIRYNDVIDEIFMGTYTDKHYEEYYKDFNNTYDIIPGSTWKIILASLVEFLGYPPLTEEEADDLVKRFEQGAVELFSNLNYNDFAIPPVIDFCRFYKEHGGEIIIHSGTNRRILETMLHSAGIEDLFTDYICADMLNVSPEVLGKWGYKTEMLKELQRKYPSNGRSDFVVGDTKGDGFGAYDCGMPFVLVWRGYPKNPFSLTAEGENGESISLTPNVIVDIRQDVVDVLTDKKKSAFGFDKKQIVKNEQYEIEDLIEFCKNKCEYKPIAEQSFAKVYCLEHIINKIVD